MTRAQSEGDGLYGTVSAFVVGLAAVLGAGVLVGRLTGSYLAVAFAAYFVTTVYDLAVERSRFRERLLARFDDGDGPLGESSSGP